MRRLWSIRYQQSGLTWHHLCCLSACCWHAVPFSRYCSQLDSAKRVEDTELGQQLQVSICYVFCFGLCFNRETVRTFSGSHGSRVSSAEAMASLQEATGARKASRGSASCRSTGVGEPCISRIGTDLIDVTPPSTSNSWICSTHVLVMHWFKLTITKGTHQWCKVAMQRQQGLHVACHVAFGL